MVKLKVMIEKITKFFKRYWIFVILAAIASGLLIFRLYQKQQPLPEPQPMPPPPISLSQPKISGTTLPSNSKISLTDFSFPSRLRIYQGQTAELSLDKAKKIAQGLNLSGSPQEVNDVFLGTFYTWSSDTAFLSVGLDTNKIGYSLDLSQVSTPQEGSLPSTESAKAELENLLSKIGLEPDFELKWQKEEYLMKNYNLPPTSSPEEADFIKVGANQTIGQYQLVSLNPTEPLISLILNKNKEVVRFQYQIYFSNFEDQETYDLKTKVEVENLLLSEGRVVYFGTFQTSVKPPEISQAEFNQITLAYYQDPDKNPILQPIYILSGQGTLEDGEKTEIVAYLPAIKFGTQSQQENLEVPREFFQIPELP
jgi:hypothetical protein